MKIFGEKLKELRLAQGLTQSELAFAIQTSKQNLSRWEKGYFEPDQETLVAIARYFGVTLDYMLGLED
ncbi:MAG: helix-turn-helix domain-containing protein [Clostridiaceae bacterium]|jgi:transcriptional regulator with XRE-family HTH domain|nr:helix-turn-helix domain-containing protein [Clostridiaceae bacterium]